MKVKDLEYIHNLLQLSQESAKSEWDRCREALHHRMDEIKDIEHHIDYDNYRDEKFKVLLSDYRNARSSLDEADRVLNAFEEKEF